ncbi:MAG: hypothetical protein QNJ68_08320 [Microcoleaceae cyanobacterium MO_207.B10]|nr:hypothetical protein [Microcoleaceae cyanobacterium MO_207.B10]
MMTDLYHHKRQILTQAFCLINLIFLTLNLPIKQSTAAPRDFISTCPTGSLSELPQPPLSQTQPSIPSLWLADNLFGKELLQTWFVNYNDTWVILMVNPLIWKQKDYLAHYKLVNNFGIVARQYGYNLQVCNIIQKQPIAAYICDFETVPLNCQVQIESLYGTSFFTPLKIFPIPKKDE